MYRVFCRHPLKLKNSFNYSIKALQQLKQKEILLKNEKVMNYFKQNNY